MEYFFKTLYETGHRSETIQRKLLAVADLTFDKAVKLASALEMADMDNQLLEPQGATGAVNKVRKFQGK